MIRAINAFVVACCALMLGAQAIAAERRRSRSGR